MDLALNRQGASRHARANLRVALWRWIQQGRARRKQRRSEDVISRLPEYLLRDIGREDLINRTVPFKDHGGLS